MQVPDTIPGIRLIVLLAVLIAMVCGTVNAATITVTDDAGTVISLNANPSRIVSLAPSNTEIVASLGLTDRLVGVTDVCDYPPEVRTIPQIGGYSSISIEKVAVARPDLVLASDITPQATTDRLRSLGLTVFILAPRNIEHMIRDIRIVGNLTGTSSRAEQLAESLSDRLSVLDPCTHSSETQTVAQVVWHDPLYISGNDTLQNDVIEHAGGVNVFAEKSGWFTVPLEELLMKNPDIIIVNGGGGMDSSEKDIILDVFMNNPQYSSLSAVKNHKVYAVNADMISRPAPRIINASEQVAHLIHPECSPQATLPSQITMTTVNTPLSSEGIGITLVAIVVLMRKRREDE